MPQCAKCPAWAGPEDWRTLCRQCYRRQKEAEEQAQDVSMARIQELTRENILLHKMLREKEALLNAQLISFALPDDKLRKLIQLCHPDKHSNSLTATEITQWLLSLRK